MFWWGEGKGRIERSWLWQEKTNRLGRTPEFVHVVNFHGADFVFLDAEDRVNDRAAETSVDEAFGEQPGELGAHEVLVEGEEGGVKVEDVGPAGEQTGGSERVGNGEVHYEGIARDGVEEFFSVGDHFAGEPEIAVGAVLEGRGIVEASTLQRVSGSLGGDLVEARFALCEHVDVHAVLRQRKRDATSDLRRGTSQKD